MYNCVVDLKKRENLSMKQTFTDFSQLSKAILKPASQAEAPKPAPTKESAAPVTESPEQTIASLRGKLQEMEAQYDAKQRECARLLASLEKAEREIESLKGECGRLKGEARKAAQTTPETGEEKSEPVPEVASVAASRGILSVPASFEEVFPDEIREILLATLAEARDTAQQSGRERRAELFNALLAVNPSSGELERRRAELKQAVKDWGYYTDPKCIEKLGFKLVSGRKHWKLEYGSVRLPIAKTPSDYRASLNMAMDLANRCL